MQTPLNASQPSPPAPEQAKVLHEVPSAAPRPDLRRRELHILLAAMAALLFVWTPKLSQTFYASDDYTLVTLQNGRDIRDLMVGQGRFVLAFLFEFVDALGAAHAKAVVMYSWLAFAVLGLCTVLLSRLWRVTWHAWLPFAIAPLIFSHPYFADLWAFRGVPVYFAISLLAALGGVWLARERSWRGVPAAVGLLVLSMGTYQLSFNPMLACIVVGVMLDLVRREAHTTPLKKVFAPWAPVLATLLGALVAYTLINKALQRLLAVPHVSRGEWLPLRDLPSRWEQLQRFFTHELLHDAQLSTPMHTGLQLSFVVLGLGLGLYGLARARQWGRSALLVPVSLAAIACLPGVMIALKHWESAPRTRITLSFIIAGHMALAALMAGKHANRLLLVLCGLLFWSSTGLTQEISGGQSRVNVRDRATAQRIFARLEVHPDFAKVRTVSISGHRIEYPDIRARADTNNSGLAVSWAMAGVMQEATGHIFRNASGEEHARGKELCQAAPKWPAAGALLVEGEAAYVCF